MRSAIHKITIDPLPGAGTVNGQPTSIGTDHLGNLCIWFIAHPESDAEREPGTRHWKHYAVVFTGAAFDDELWSHVGSCLFDGLHYHLLVER